MSQQGVIVVGAGGHGKVVVATLQAAGRTVAEVWDDDPGKAGGELLGVPVVGPIAERIAEAEGRQAVLGIGDNRIRRRLAADLPLTWISAVHPSAVVHSSVRVGEGTVVFAGAVVQPDAVLGRHAIVNTGATVDHDCGIGDFVHVAPGVHLAGEVSVGEGAVLGIGVKVLPGRTVGAWATVGAGSVVVHDVPAEATVAGIPARQRDAERSARGILKTATSDRSLTDEVTGERRQEEERE